MKLLAALLAALLVACQGVTGEGPEPELDLDRYISYIGRTGAEIREELGYGPEDWVFYDYIAGGPFFRLEGQECCFGFSGEEADYDRAPDGARCVEVCLLFPEWDRGIAPLEQKLGTCFEYDEEYGNYFAADMERRLMFYVGGWDGGFEEVPWLQILCMNDENYAALQREAEQEG